MSNVTIKDIAREAGFAISTVSRALNNHPDVSEETKKRVQEVVDAYNFVPNNNAKKLKQQTTTVIAIIIKGTFNTMFASIVEQMQHRITHYGFHSESYYLEEWEDEVRFAIQISTERKPVAIVFLGGNIESFKASFNSITIPSVLVTTPASELDFTNLSSVCTDDVLGAYRAVEYLVQNGHRKIGVIGGSLESSFTSRQRYTGCANYFRENGIVFDTSKQYRPARFSFSDAYDAMKSLIDSCPDITAVFAMSDVMAMGAIRALNDLGKKVPEDISLIGYDGIEPSQYYTPRLASIKQEQDQIAKSSVDILISCIRKKSDAVHQIIPFQLIEGESVKKI